VEVVDGFAGESRQNGCEIVAGVDLQPPAGFEDGEDGSDPGPCVLMSEVYPVFSTDSYSAHGVLGQVVR